jgi:uncharacterized protein YoxC
MVNFRQTLIAILIAATLVAGSALAQTNLTQILDTITNPDGTPFNGTVVITWNGYSGSGSGTVSRLSTSARVYNGALSVLLVPTTTASPGTYYEVVYSSSDGTVTWTETWQVPPSTTALTIADVRQTSTQGTGTGTGTGTGGGQYATLPISISEVTDLASDLNSIDNSISTMQTSAATLGTTVGTLNTTVTGLGATITGLNTTVTGLSTSVSGLNTTVSGNSAAITTLTSNLAALTTTVAGDTGSLNTVSGTVTGLTTNVTNLTNLVNGLNATVNTLSAAGTTAVFVDDEVPAGAINGANLAFSLANTPAPVLSLTLFRNGLELAQGSDYSLNGSAITFATAGVPQTGDTLIAYYRMAGTGSATNFTDNETPGGSINGTNLTFTLASSPNPAGSLRLYRNGLLVAPGGDYTLSGSSIAFTSATTPRTGDSLAAYYRH